MAHGPTRERLTLERDALARENAMLRKEVEYAKDATVNVRTQVRQIASDRERLTATVEILARRLASEGVNQNSPSESAKVPYPKH